MVVTYTDMHTRLIEALKGLYEALADYVHNDETSSRDRIMAKLKEYDEATDDYGVSGIESDEQLNDIDYWLYEAEDEQSEFSGPDIVATLNCKLHYIENLVMDWEEVRANADNLRL